MSDFPVGSRVRVTGIDNGTDAVNLNGVTGTVIENGIAIQLTMVPTTRTVVLDPEHVDPGFPEEGITGMLFDTKELELIES